MREKAIRISRGSVGLRSCAEHNGVSLLAAGTANAD
jgi:hypothetical protein